MSHSPLYVIAPTLAPSQQSTTEVFGSVVWLWMQSARHCSAPVGELNELIMPAILAGQYALMLQDKQPVAYVSWACLDEATEAIYLEHVRLYRPEQWTTGDRKWVTDFIAPFGHARALTRFMQHTLFANDIGRTVYHRSDERQQSIRHLRGNNVTPAAFRSWQQAHPIHQP